MKNISLSHHKSLVCTVLSFLTVFSNIPVTEEYCRYHLQKIMNIVGWKAMVLEYGLYIWYCQLLFHFYVGCPFYELQYHTAKLKAEDTATGQKL